MSPVGRRTVDLVLLAVVAGAALVGGLIAMVALAFLDELRPGLMLVVVMVVTVLAVLTVASLQTSRGRRAPEPVRAPWPPTWEGPGTVSVPETPRTWYDDAPPAPPDAAHRAVVPMPSFAPVVTPAPPPDLRPPDYAYQQVPGARSTAGSPVRRVVQCPGCGDFDVQVRQEGEQLTFTCLARGHQWTWRHGEPWPATVVRPAAAPLRHSGTV